jgi:FkbM family methyltransferase
MARAKSSAVGKAVKTLRRFTKRFGPAGVSLWARYLPLELGMGQGLAALYLPNVKFPIYLRKGTTDKDVFFQIFLIREYDFEGVEQYARLKSVYRDAVAKGETPLILDCGANIGLASIWLALRFPQARIYAIEPDEGNFSVLCANTKDYPNIVPLQAAIWDRITEKLAIANKDGVSCGYQVEALAADAGSGLPVHTVPEIMRMAGAANILLAKIDIEGGEQALFRSNTDWLDATHALAIELHDWMLPGKASSRNFFMALARHPFEVVWHSGIMLCAKMPVRP